MKKTTILCRLITLLMVFALPIGTFAWTSVTFVSSDNSELNGKSLKKVDNNNFQYELDLTLFESNPTFKFHVSDDDGFYISNYDNNATIKDFGGNTQYWCSKKGSVDFTLDLNSNTLYNKCTITLKYENDGDDKQTYWTVKVTGTELKEGVQDPNVYYLVSKELTDGNMRKGFMFSRSREREGGSELGRYQTLNFQNFLMDKNHKDKESITYQIIKGDGTVVFSPNSNHKNYNLGKEGVQDNDINQGEGTIYAKYKCNGQNNETYFQLDRDLGVSYTFFIDTESKELSILANKKYVGKTDFDADGYYIVGNFKEAKANIKIDPSSENGRRKMRQSWFKDGIEYLYEQKDADSILYRATIPKPAAGWSELYLAVFSQNDIKNWGSDNVTNWAKAIRPQVQWAMTGYPNGLDATALHGGLYSRQNGSGDMQQALNPQVDDSYTSYTFTMNITTSTYNLVFNKGMYIMGPAVSDTDDNDSPETDGWDCSDPDHQTKHALRMYYDQDTRCYYYYGKQPDGTISVDRANTEEKPIHFEAGEKFLFVYNKDFTKTIFQGDRVAPKSLINSKGNSTETQVIDGVGVYRLADNDYENNNKDTQYVNYLRTGNTASQTYDSNQARACDFGLPTGDYYIRLYIRQDGDMQKIYYILRRAYTFYRPYADKVGEYDTFKSFCDYHAVIIPNDIDVLYVSSADKETMEAKLTKYEPEVINQKRVLSAGMPVILAKKTNSTNTKLETDDIVLEYYEEPNYVTKTNVTDNLLRGQIERKHLEVKDEENGKSNYIFGYKKRNGNDKPATIGFYAPGTGECSINTAYLQIDGGISAEAASKGWKLVFDSETTTIDTPEINTIMSDCPYYTIQGIRTNTPTTKGIYIHGGKKVIIK